MEGDVLMSRATIAERANLSWLVARRAARNAAGRVRGHPLVRWQFLTTKADRLVIAPQDLRTADPTRASEIYAGRFVFAGKAVTCDGLSPFETTPPSDEWATQLLGFGWLRHLRAAESGITRANARALVDEWISIQGAWNAIAWRPEVLARRVIVWLTQAPLILHDTDVQFYKRFLRSLMRQVRYLRHTAADARDGVPRLQCLIALTYAALCMAGQMRHLSNATKRLAAEIERQILPDGGHISRNPNALVELLLDFLPLRQAFSARNMAPPAALLNAIDRMMPMLRFFRHGDGAFALFNGMGATYADQLATILGYDDARGRPVANAPHSGYQRIESHGLVILVDTGATPPVSVSQEAHAGCLSFELSWKLQRIFVNCGVPPTNRDSWRHVTRATAAHSTAVFNDTSSARFLEAGAFQRILGNPMVGGPSKVSVERQSSDDALILRASHDGYASRFGIIHQRTLFISIDGMRLDGEDIWLPADGAAMPPNDADEFAIRFHLHPAIKATRLTDSYSVLLVLPDRDAWTFSAYDDPVEIEESVYLAGADGPRRSQQIVIYGRARKVQRINWGITQTAAASAPAGRRSRDDEPELPL